MDFTVGKSVHKSDTDVLDTVHLGALCTTANSKASYTDKVD